nr:MAG TPA: hypothetical protein [Caudoviricetes sp.]
MGNELLTGFLAGQGDGNKNNGGFFGNEGLWAVIILAIIFGWGRNGFANNGGDGNGAIPYMMAMGAGAAQGGLTRADMMSEFGFKGLEDSVRAVQNGLCDGFYAANTTAMQGFHGVDNAICNLGYQTQQGFNGVERGQNAIQTQLASCCCENGRAMERGFADVGYRMATDTCAINTNAANNTRDIIDAVNAGFRGVDARLTEQRIADKDAQIAAQNQRIFALELAASQAAQNQYLVNAIGPKAPVPAFRVPAPWQWQGNNGGGCCCN